MDVEQQLASLVRSVEETADHRAEVLARPAADPPDAWDRRAAAAVVHECYNGVENVLKRVVTVVDRRLPSGPAWHGQLIDGAAEHTPARPAVLSAALHSELLASTWAFATSSARTMASISTGIGCGCFSNACLRSLIASRARSGYSSTNSTTGPRRNRRCCAAAEAEGAIRRRRIQGGSSVEGVSQTSRPTGWCPPTAVPAHGQRRGGAIKWNPCAGPAVRPPPTGGSG